MMDWEQIDDWHQRTKIRGGWLVKAYENIWEMYGGAESPQDGHNYRVSMCFVPDPGHEWEIE